MIQNNKLIYGLIGVFIGGILVWFFATNTTNNNNQGVINNSSLIDAHFIEQMIPHHEDAIIMAKLAETKAKRPEVKKLAKDIIDSQGREIDQMKDWYKEWNGRDVPTGTQVMNQHGMMRSDSNMHMGMMGDRSDITRLEQAPDFDKAFIEDMIPHHQMAVMMATMLKNGTGRPEMVRLAEDIISAQTKEINEMRQWYKNWGY